MSAIDYRAQTVLITGASAGLGAEFARRLAARGADLVLVARRADRLERLAAELPGVTVTTIAMDLAAPGAGERLSAAVAERGVTVTSLINNAGFGTNAPFHEEDPARVDAEIALNVTSLVGITRAFIDRLRAGDGFLINLASIVAYQSNPRMAVYGATKAFVLSFTEALWYESRGTGLRVLAVSPGPTETEFFEVAGQAADGGNRRMRADQVVDRALRALDRRNPPPSVVTGAANRTMTFANRLVSRRLQATVVGKLMERSAGAPATISTPSA
ncbi:SDR family NAD(P)-dependent oxidoreductase [Actinoplanes palleronii]|uniref:Dehydrogenase n=1 Tax=Actinoplanes palleronii TaxID=113570 RepID=A0ABQ4B0D8_9ACTN|nr:SDR family oxidoreductase [Actinoplanes palleronii]GIE64139.1 dehydrogenase [Actinoplanes palleronii]